MADTESEQMWRNMLTGSDPDLARMNRLMKRLPSGPRCKLCSAPFGTPGRYLVAPFGFRRWASNPALCRICARGLDKTRGGAEVDATFLFADIRGSTGIAERTSAGEFRALLERFYTSAGGRSTTPAASSTSTWVTASSPCSCRASLEVRGRPRRQSTPDARSSVRPATATGRHGCRSAWASMPVRRSWA